VLRASGWIEKKRGKKKNKTIVNIDRKTNFWDGHTNQPAAWKNKYSRKIEQKDIKPFNKILNILIRKQHIPISAHMMPYAFFLSGTEKRQFCFFARADY